MAPVVVVKDVVHVKDKKHDALSLEPHQSVVPLWSPNYTGRVSSLIVRLDDPAEKSAGLFSARDALARGEVIVMPTDTVYGIASDAFSPAAVETLVAAKGRGRHMPPPVLVGSVDDVADLVRVVPEGAKRVMDHFWPGGVTIIFDAHPDVQWDLGDTSGTVAIRMPNHPVALELLAITGPLAVSSANKTGQLPAVTCDEACDQLGDAVTVYLDAGAVGQAYEGPHGNPGSTIIDASALDAGGPWRVVRHGVCPVGDIRVVAGGEWQD
jgi:L-threonylcarbamoyladenylate synthase